MRDLECALDIALLGERLAAPVEQIGRLYFSAHETLGLPMLKAAAASIPCRNATESDALVGLVAQMERSFSTLVKTVAASSAGAIDEEEPKPDTDRSPRHRQQTRLQSLLSDLRRGEPPSLAMLVVANQALFAIAET
jgi:NAD-specific glutamate dehydrogenase